MVSRCVMHFSNFGWQITGNTGKQAGWLRNRFYLVFIPYLIEYECCYGSLIQDFGA